MALVTRNLGDSLHQAPDTPSRLPTSSRAPRSIAMATAVAADHAAGPATPFQSPTFEKDVIIKVEEDFTAASISPSGRDVVLAG
jgi:hypothetical protein